MCEYVGEIITDLEADLREDDSYLFDLDNRVRLPWFSYFLESIAWIRFGMVWKRFGNNLGS